MFLLKKVKLEGYIIISYKNLLLRLENKGLTKTDLTSLLGISSRTIAKISRAEKIADHVLIKIADFLDCSPQDLYKMISENAYCNPYVMKKNYIYQVGFMMNFRFV